MATNNPFRILIDTNVLIDLERHDEGQTQLTEVASRFSAMAAKADATIAVSQATRDDLLRAAKPLRDKRLLQLSRYHVMPMPHIDPQVVKLAGYVEPLSNNNRSDLEIVATVANNGVTWLVTNDDKLRARAARVGLRDRVFTLAEAADALEALVIPKPSTDRANFVEGIEVDLSATIFDSLRDGYEDFDSWWRGKVCLERRPVLIVGDTDNPLGISVLKQDDPDSYGFPSPSLKICTFRVHPNASGSRIGELLLFDSLRFARDQGSKSVFVEVDPELSFLVSWFKDFGFREVEGVETGKRDIVLRKLLVGPELEPLDHAITYGPGAISLQNPKVIPIRPEFRRVLIPAKEQQQTLFDLGGPSSNSIRKVYLSHSSSRIVGPGDTLLFYESSPAQRLIAIGVAEEVFVTDDPSFLTKEFGKRTVYTRVQIDELCREGEVLAIGFRLDRVLESAISRVDAVSHGLFKSPPQAIQSVGDRGARWLKQNIDKLH